MAAHVKGDLEKLVRMRKETGQTQAGLVREALLQYFANGLHELRSEKK